MAEEQENLAGAPLRRVLSSDRFRRSKRNSELLAYLAKEVSEGRADAISGTSVAQDVFDKGVEFDPATDPSVRVQMGRLRKMLADHYAEEGREDDVRIVLPKASYVPELVTAECSPCFSPPAVADGNDDESSDDTSPAFPFNVLHAIRRHPRTTAALSLATLLLAAAGLFRSGDTALALPGGAIRDYPVVHVQPFSNRTGNPENDLLERGMQRQVAADIERFHVARVALDGAGTQGGAAPDFMLSGTILSTEPDLDMIVQLISAENGAVLSGERLTVTGENDYAEAVEELSSRVSSSFGGPSGMLATTMLERFARDDADTATFDGDLGAFRCLSRFHAFEDARTVPEHGFVRDCLAHHSGRNPQDGTLLSALAWTLLLGSAEAGLLDTTNMHPPHDPGYALQLAERAVAIDPGNDDAHEYLGLIEWFSGYRGRALSSLRRAVTLNPANARHRANYGLFSILANRDVERGRELVRGAIDWHIDPPAWYRTAFLHAALMEGNGEEATAVIDGGATRGDPFEPVYRLAAASIAGDQAEVERLVPIVRDYAAERDGDPLDGIRNWLADTEVLHIVERELLRNGIEVPRVIEQQMVETPKRSAVL